MTVVLTPPQYLVSWWAQVSARRPVPERGIPAWYGTATGEPTVHPWSAVLGATQKLPSVINLDKLRKNVFALLGVTP